jgi:hypothetical protein
MIHYSLVCDNKHTFESWFADSAAYDKQVKRKLVTCPHCGSAKVEKAIMAPRVADSKQKKRARRAMVSEVAASMPQAAAAAAPDNVPVVSPQERELRAKLKALREAVTKNADNVGERFPEEARKMHYGESEHRSIYGEASPEQARDLIEEGIEVYPMPILPDDQN